MRGNANKIVVAVAAVLAVLTLALVVGSGSCSGGGGGGAPALNGSPSLPASAAASGPTSSTSTAATANSSASTTGSAPASTDGDWNGNASYEELRDRLKQEVSEGTARVGSNARDASTYPSVMTVSAAYAELASRGFGAPTLSASFDMQGNYVRSTDLDPASTEKYPSYQATYQSAQGVEWRIVINGDKLFAVPVSSANAALAKDCVFSESDSVMQYDGTRNLYSDFSFADLDGKTGVTVGRIDAATLESYSADSLNKL